MNPKKQRSIEIWLWSGAGMIFLMLVIGGTTRLTGSGLSMSDWSLIMGTLPPMNETEWLAAFEQYKQFPQYQQINSGMTLEEFKGIFFWEYLHRVTGRATGIIFMVPFLFFWLRRYFNPKLFKRVLFLLGLGALQAAMGWIMVKSGLVDLPYVSHYRLAAHLLLAFALAGCCVWFALDLRQKNTDRVPKLPASMRSWTHIIMLVFLFQLTWGAFTAGLNAGYIYNTFPLMNGEWLPQHAWVMHPALLNLLENPGTVQWIHRLAGTVLTLLVVGLWMKVNRLDTGQPLKLKGHLLLGIIAVQYMLGVYTLLFSVPVALGLAHQAVAMLFWVVLLTFYHELVSPPAKKLNINRIRYS